MLELISLLAGGDLSSDGRADEAPARICRAVVSIGPSDPPWAISSLALIGRRFPSMVPDVERAIARQAEDRSVAVRNRAAKALAALGDPHSPLPRGWDKTE